MSDLRGGRVSARVGVGDARAAEAASASAARTTSAAGIDAPVWSALRTAAADVAATWPETSHVVSASGEVQLTAAALVDAVRQIAAGSAPDLSRLPVQVSARRILERIRASFLDGPAAREPGAHATGVLVVTRCIERLQAALDDDAAHRFASRLSGSDAQQLVVEMAHDMRSPLGSILILAERLRAGAGGEVPPIHQRQLGLIYSAAFGLSALAGDVIELARGGTTLIDQEPLAFAVSDVLQSIGDILRPMAEEKRLELTWDSPAADVRVGHPAALNRVLLNLATNAIKFTNAGSVRIACRELDRRRVEFAVIDTGRGIPEHVMVNLFEAFRQRQAPGDYAFSSAGLGLSICRKLVRAMGSDLEVSTELEHGTRFRFTLVLPQPERL